MNYVGQLAESVYVTVKELYEGLNPATLSGGIDVLVVKQPDGSFLCSPFHVRFGKLGVLRSREKVVDIEINGEPVDLQMKLGDNGEAFFVQQLETTDEEIPTNLYTSPIPPECSNEVLNDPLLDLIENVHKHSSETTMSQRKKRRRRKKVKKKDKLILTTTPATSSEELEEVQAEIVVEDRPMTELSSTRDQTEEDVSTQHKDSYLYLNMESLHKESFYTAEDELVGPKDSFIYSDVEFSRNESSLSSEYLTSIRSDSELEIKFGNQNTTRTEPQMQWHWGRLPQVVKGEHVKLLRSSQSNTSINPLLCEESICQIATSDPLANSETILQDGQNISGAPSLLKLPSYSGSTRSLGLIKFCPSSRILTTSKDSLAQNSEEGRTENIQEMNSSFDSTVLPQGLTGQEGSDSSKQKKERKDTQRRSQHSKSSDTYLEGLSSLNSATFPQSEINLQAQQWSDSCFSESKLLQPTVMGDDTTALLSDASLEQDNNVELSLCGGLAENQNISTEKFAKYAVSYKNLADNPGILDDPNLVVKIGKKYYNWAVAAPMILSLQAFQKSLPKSTVDKLVKEKMPKKTGRWWFSWGIKDSASEKNEVQEVASTSKKTSIQQGKESLTIEEDPLSIPVVLDSPSPPQSSASFKKSLRLSSDQLRDLNLREGANDVVFSVTTQYQGTCRCHANIYLWNWYDKVVVSDIDGTITRSDALGHILPQLGKDWTHRGIIKLYHKIHLNGYKFLYCSARSIGLADLTKGYLKWVHEHDCGLPKGPLLLTPSSLFSALHREVIEKKPEVFKIACLTDIRNLFLPHGDPFFAGFGNRASDVDAYLQAGISKSRIFTINPQGELVQEHIKNHKTTYDRLRECVELIFPPIKLGPSVELVKPEYSQFCYWRNPLVKVHPRDLILD